MQSTNSIISSCSEAAQPVRLAVLEAAHLGVATEAVLAAMAVMAITEGEAPVEQGIFAVICGALIPAVNVWEGIFVHAYK